MDKSEWKKRIVNRADFTAGLVHLTKGREIDGKKYSSLEILFKILKEQKLEGSTTQTGYISGSTPAVFFQDIPLFSVCENIFYEQKLKNQGKVKDYRYTGYGLRFPKEYIYRNSGRPVIYDDPNIAKQYLKSNEYWRIVNLNLSNDNNIIDWSHEREWRLPGNLEFELSEVEVLIHDYNSYKKFIQKCRGYKQKDILYEVKSIIVLPSILF